MRLVSAGKNLMVFKRPLVSDFVSEILIRPFGAGRFHQEMFKYIYRGAHVR